MRRAGLTVEQAAHPEDRRLDAGDGPNERRARRDVAFAVPVDFLQPRPFARDAFESLRRRLDELRSDLQVLFRKLLRRDADRPRARRLASVRRRTAELEAHGPGLFIEADHGPTAPMQPGFVGRGHVHRLVEQRRCERFERDVGSDAHAQRLPGNDGPSIDPDVQAHRNARLLRSARGSGQGNREKSPRRQAESVAHGRLHRKGAANALSHFAR